jgi:hypothetical protein
LAHRNEQRHNTLRTAQPAQFVAGVIDVPAAVEHTIREAGVVARMAKQEGVTTTLTHVTGTRQLMEAVFGYDVLTGEKVDRWAKAQEGLTRFSSTLMTLAGAMKAAGVDATLIPRPRLELVRAGMFGAAREAAEEAPLRQMNLPGMESEGPGTWRHALEDVPTAQGTVPGRVPIPGDADYVGPIQRGWTLTPQGAGAHMVPRVNVRGRQVLAAFDEPGTPRFYPAGTPENAGAAHTRLHEAVRNAGIGLREGSNAALSDAELLQRYRKAYADPRLNGIRGDVRTPDGTTAIAKDVTPAEAFEALQRWYGGL